MSGKSFTAVLTAAVAVAAALAAVCAAAGAGPSAENEADVSEYLKSCGLKPSLVSRKDVTIPEVFSEVYENYNKLQKEKGFDLSAHKGHSAVSYTYSLSGYMMDGEVQPDTEAHVLVCDGRIIGGDVASTRLDGFMVGLERR